MKMRRIVALLTVCMVVAGSLTITAQAENLYSESIVQMEEWEDGKKLDYHIRAYKNTPTDFRRGVLNKGE